MVFIFWITSLPEWASGLKPEAEFHFLYEEIKESGSNESGLALGGRFGIFPEWNENWELGLELKLIDSSPEARLDMLSLNKGPSNRPVGLSQFYIAHKYKDLLLLSAGKFHQAFRSSPLLWDDDIKPEGFYQALNLPLHNPHAKIKLHAGQFVLNRAHTDMSSGGELQRSWLFIQGLEGRYYWSQLLEFVSSLQIYYFHDLPDQINELSARRGAEYKEQANTYISKSSKYLPLEIEAEVASRPLGIFTSIRLAASFNLKTEDKQRGLYAETQIGRPWKKHNVLARLSFYYNEPMASVAAFVERDYGYANRKAGLFELNYYLSDNFRIGASYLIAKVLQDSLFQASRHEWRAGIGWQL